MGGDGLYDRDFAAFVAEGGRLRCPEMVYKKIGARAVALIDHENISDFQQSGLHRLNIVAAFRRQYHQGRVGEAGDLDLVLAHSDGLDDDGIEWGNFQQIGDFDYPRVKAAQRSAGRKAADEDSRVVIPLAHSDAVAEQGAEVECGGRVYTKDRYFFVFADEVRDQCVHQGALTDARGTGYSDDLDGRRGQVGQQGRKVPDAVFHIGDGSRQRFGIAVADLLQKLRFLTVPAGYFLIGHFACVSCSGKDKDCENDYLRRMDKARMAASGKPGVEAEGKGGVEAEGEGRLEAEGEPRTFIISRADAIGDVVLTLPVAGVLRRLYPSSRILFLGRSYTREVIRACVHIDGFIDWDEWRKLPSRAAVRELKATNADTIIHVFPKADVARLAWRARVRQRIGTTNRLYHYLYCNTLVPLSRRRSPLHESQLNLRLLVPLGGKPFYTLEEIGGYYGLTRLAPLPPTLGSLLAPDRFNLILHPKSRGNGREWGLDNFRQLIALLPQDRYKLFLTGTAAEGQLLLPLVQEFPFLTDLTGQLSLDQLLSFISAADGLVASGTGPLHLAAALGIHALGIFPPIRPIHPGRWAPVGPRAKFFVKDKDCEACRQSMDCRCIREIAPQELYDYLQAATGKGK